MHVKVRHIIHRDQLGNTRSKWSVKSKGMSHTPVTMVLMRSAFVSRNCVAESVIVSPSVKEKRLSAHLSHGAQGRIPVDALDAGAGRTRPSAARLAVAFQVCKRLRFACPSHQQRVVRSLSSCCAPLPHGCLFILLFRRRFLVLGLAAAVGRCAGRRRRRRAHGSGSVLRSCFTKRLTVIPGLAIFPARGATSKRYGTNHHR